MEDVATKLKPYEQILTLAFKTSIIPNQLQSQALASNIGAVRFAYNWSVDYVKTNWAAAKADSSIEYVKIDAYSLRKALNTVKSEVAPWYVENSKEAFATGCANAASAFRHWFDSRKGNRAGVSMSFPKFKSRHHDSSPGIIFTTGLKRLESDARYFTLPKIGKVRLAERLTRVCLLLNRGGTIGNVTVSSSQGRWWIVINVRVTKEIALQYFNERHKRKNNKQIGIDVGVKTFLTDSEGKVVENPQFLRASLAKIRKVNKRLTRRKRLDQKTGELASNRWKIAHKQLLKAHAKISNQRLDFSNKLSTQLVLENKLIGVEDLNVRGMMRNPNLSLSIADASWGEFKRQLKYKAIWYGSQVVEVDRFFPSTKTCSKCGSVKVKLTLSERTYKCEQCGLIMDRDENAARTIKAEAIRLNEKHVAQSCGETVNGRGGKSAGLVVISSETIFDETSSRTSVLQPL